MDLRDENLPKAMGKIPITPQMLRTAVKELQMRQVFVKSKNLREHLLRHYPVESNLEALEEELQEKLTYAVYVGLLIKHGDDEYCIPTLRQEANIIKTAISAFWELYKNNKSRNTKKKKSKRLESRQKRKDRTNSSKSDETDEDLDFI